MFKQSANTLFRFTSKLEYLIEILKDKHISPRYNEEYVDYLKLNEGIKKIAIPMVCFCDIKLKELGNHMKLYNDFGIGLNKEWGIKKGVQPIQYVNEKSVLCKMTSSLINSCLDEENEIKNEDLEYSIIYQLLYMKPLKGNMMRDDGIKKCNFHDEHEWRYIPDINVLTQKGMEGLIVNENKLNQSYYNTYSDTLKTIKESWLEFEYDDIKYIIVKERYLDEIIQSIKFLSLDRDVEVDLISKILVYDRMEVDW